MKYSTQKLLKQALIYVISYMVSLFENVTLRANSTYMIRCLAKGIYHLIGWRLEGRYPHKLKKKILIVAPHTSTMDFPIGILIKFWLNIKASFYAKEELFTGIRGWALKKIGGLPVDRSKNNNLVSQAIADFNTKKELTLLITPEGTRKKVDKFKSGFYVIAHKANIPVVPIVFDYSEKAVRILPTYKVQGNGPSEIEEIRQLFVGFVGKVPENSLT